MIIRLPLPFGLVAVVEADESDRLPYLPRPLDRSDHHEACRCDACVMTRQMAGPVGRHP